MNFTNNFRVCYTKFNTEIYVVPISNVTQYLQDSYIESDYVELSDVKFEIYGTDLFRIYGRYLVNNGKLLKSMYIITSNRDIEINIQNLRHGIYFKSMLRSGEAIILMVKLMRFLKARYHTKLPVQFLKGLGFRNIQIQYSSPEVIVLKCRDDDFFRRNHDSIISLSINILHVGVDIENLIQLLATTWRNYILLIFKCRSFNLKITSKYLLKNINLGFWRSNVNEAFSILVPTLIEY